MDASTVAGWVTDARQRTIDLVQDLDDAQIMGPQLDIINPLLWEIGHVAWFTEKWVLRETAGRGPIVPNADELWDSMAIAHDTRWELPLLSRADTLRYLYAVRDAVLDLLEKDATPDLLYKTQYCVFHEDMHTEAFTYSRQTLGYQRPPFSINSTNRLQPETDRSADVWMAPGSFMLGAGRDAPFVFDNEMWEHEVEVAPFGISHTAVTQSEFADFVDDGGYDASDLWSDDGWQWRVENGASHPVYWRKQDDQWIRRDFDRWVELEPNLPVIHVNWHESMAFCKWAKRRLPTEAEWEAVASLDKDGSGKKLRFPWGDTDDAEQRVNMDWRVMGCVAVNAHPAGDSLSGCRQLLGNVWEWTSDDFHPYPEFTPDFYKEYSEPWFHTRKVLRGGSWATRSRMLRNTWRNFYEPHRRDVLAGFRTCAITV